MPFDDKNVEPVPRIKKSTGIPRSFMMEVKDPTTKGAMLTSTGKYAIPTISAEAYARGKKEKPPFLPEEPSSSSSSDDPIPEEFLCLLCKALMTDAVVIPCCGNSYCDECIRTALLDSEEHTCPTCHQTDISPDALIANKALRKKLDRVELGDTEAIGAKKLVSPVKPLKAQKGCSSVKETWTTAQLKCLYAIARSMGNKQEELEAIVHQENDDMFATTETWWADSHNWSVATDGYKLFRRDKQGRRGGGVALYVRECLDSLGLDDGDERVECLWVRIRGKANKADIVVGVCYRPPNQDEETDELF
ncbi:hypothetical protein QYF61_025742 [Mycteria americana]|uniref:RING-type domain-containing protein n=2 Tax=Mycteria americana TaxID=33587 RepID=A0AAN7MGL3_MYCAM|nr:hypothetical protein QYF61_025742 [Mycteria americana]